ncbi:hypothetical protein [Pseudomonas sp. P5_C3]
MSVTISHKVGLEVPEEWRTLQILEIWIVAIDGEPMGVFFSGEEANAYAHWTEWRISEELKRSSEPSSGPRLG